MLIPCELNSQLFPQPGSACYTAVCTYKMYRNVIIIRLPYFLQNMLVISQQDPKLLIGEERTQDHTSCVTGAQTRDTIYALRKKNPYETRLNSGVGFAEWRLRNTHYFPWVYNIQQNIFIIPNKLKVLEDSETKK